MEGAQAEWARLAGRALEPCPFAGPDFLLSAARHLTFEARPRFVAVHDAGGRLVGVFPLAPAALLTAGGLLRLWSADPRAPVPPLIDRDRAEEVLAAFFDWAGAQSLAAGILFPNLPDGGPLRQLLAVGRRLETFDAERSPALPGTETQEDEAPLIVTSGPEEIREVVERFLTLDARGRPASGRRGAFDAGQATFVRAVTRLLSAQGRCRAAALDRAGAVAMALIVEGGGRKAVWRLAADAPSAGARLLDRLRADRLLSDPFPATDVAVSLRGGFDAACRRERNRRRFREMAARLSREE